MNKLDWVIESKIDISGFKDKVDDVVKTIDPIDYNKVSTRGSGSKQFRLWEEREKLSDIIKKIKDCVVKNYNVAHTRNIEKLKLLNLWTVYGTENSYHKLHNHIKSQHLNQALNHISTVTYLDVPEKNIHQSGKFYFVFLKNNQVMSSELDIEVGKFIIMPVWIWHGAYPQGKGLRQTLNMDFKI